MGNYTGDQFYYNANPAIPDDSQNRVFLPAVTTGNIQVSKAFGANLNGTLFINNIADCKYKEIFSGFLEQNASYLPGRTVGVTFNGRF